MNYKYGMGGYPNMMGYGGPKKYQDGDTLDPYTQSLIDSGRFKMGPDGVLIATTDEEKLASGEFVQNPDGSIRPITPEEYAQQAYQKSMDEAAMDRMRRNPLPTDADIDYYNRLNRPLTEQEARHYAARSFDPSQPPNMAFSMVAGAGGPGAAADMFGMTASNLARGAANRLGRRAVMRGIDETVEYLDDAADAVPTRTPSSPSPSPARGPAELGPAQQQPLPRTRQLPAQEPSSGRTFYGNEGYQYRHTTGSVDAAGNPIGGRYGSNVPGGTSIGQQGLVRSGAGVPARAGARQAVPTGNTAARAAIEGAEGSGRVIPVSGRTVTPRTYNPQIRPLPAGMFIPDMSQEDQSGSTESLGTAGVDGQTTTGPAPRGGDSDTGNAGGSGSGSGGSGSPEFNQAFREARHRGDMVFEWNGKSYGTRRKGETNDQHQMAMDQVRIKSRAAEVRNLPTEIGIQEPKEISFDRPTAQLQTPQRPAAAKAAPKSEPTGRAKIKANRQENRSIRQGMRSERQANRKENRADRLENRASKLRGNSKPAATSNKAKEDKAMSQINAAANRPMKDGGLKTPTNKGLKKLPKEVRNKMGFKKDGGKKQMIKRADGSYSQRGLWDNIRANKGSGKKPTKEMLKQEKKIKAESKKDGGLKTPTNKGLKKLPKSVRNKMGFKKEGGLKDRRK